MNINSNKILFHSVMGIRNVLTILPHFSAMPSLSSYCILGVIEWVSVPPARIVAILMCLSSARKDALLSSSVLGEASSVFRPGWVLLLLPLKQEATALRANNGNKQSVIKENTGKYRHCQEIRRDDAINWVNKTTGGKVLGGAPYWAYSPATETDNAKQ